MMCWKDRVATGSAIAQGRGERNGAANETDPAVRQGPHCLLMSEGYSAAAGAFFLRSRLGTSRSSMDFFVAGFS